MEKGKYTENPEITLVKYRKVREDAARNVYHTKYVIDYDKLEEYFRKADTTKSKVSALIGRNNGHIHAIFGNENKQPSPFGSEMLEDIVAVLNRMLPDEHLSVGDFVIREIPLSSSYKSRLRSAVNRHLKKAGFVNPDGSVMTEEDVIAFEEGAKKDISGDGSVHGFSAVQMELFGPEMAEFGKAVKENSDAGKSVSAEKEPENGADEQIRESENENTGGIADNSKEIVPALKNLLSALGMTIEEYAERSGFNETDRDLITRYDLITNRNADILRNRLLP